MEWNSSYNMSDTDMHPSHLHHNPQSYATDCPMDIDIDVRQYKHSQWSASGCRRRLKAKAHHWGTRFFKPHFNIHRSASTYHATSMGLRGIMMNRGLPNPNESLTITTSWASLYNGKSLVFDEEWMVSYVVMMWGHFPLVRGPSLSYWNW